MQNDLKQRGKSWNKFTGCPIHGNVFWKKKTMQIFNKSSTLQLAAYVTKMQQISIYLAVHVSEYITDVHSYRHTNFTISLKRNANTLALIACQQTYHR